MNLVDLVIILAAVAYAVGGYRNGAILGAFSLAGFFGGAALGAQLARPLSSHVAGGNSQVAVAIVCVLLVATIGQVTAVWVAGHVRRRVTWKTAQAVDSSIGAVLGIVSVLLVSWMIAVPIASSPYTSLASAARRSVIVKGVDGVMPSGVRQLYSSLERFINRSGFPQVFGDLQATRIVNVGPVDPTLVNAPAVTTDHASTFKIVSDAPSCDRGIEGSGFVYAPQRILTNAHVVAGTSTVGVQTATQGTLAARVVVFDPERDVAVLYVPGLKATPLPFAAAPAATDASAVVLGYPEDGPFDVQPARIRNLGTITGHDIYGQGSITREIYSVRSLVRSGNSGGPLINPDGSVLGIVFATALDSSDTGFVLSYKEIQTDSNSGIAAVTPVSTQGCT